MPCLYAAQPVAHRSLALSLSVPTFPHQRHVLLPTLRHLEAIWHHMACRGHPRDPMHDREHSEKIESQKPPK
jgi:hypothetical protein